MGYGNKLRECSSGIVNLNPLIGPSQAVNTCTAIGMMKPGWNPHGLRDMTGRPREWCGNCMGSYVFKVWGTTEGAVVWCSMALEAASGWVR